MRKLQIGDRVEVVKILGHNYSVGERVFRTGSQTIGFKMDGYYNCVSNGGLYDNIRLIFLGQESVRPIGCWIIKEVK